MLVKGNHLAYVAYMILSYVESGNWKFAHDIISHVQSWNGVIYPGAWSKTGNCNMIQCFNVNSWTNCCLCFVWYLEFHCIVLGAFISASMYRWIFRINHTRAEIQSLTKWHMHPSWSVCILGSIIDNYAYIELTRVGMGKNISNLHRN